MTPIADALAAALEQIEGLRVFSYIPDSLEPPAAFISFPTITYDVDMSEDALAVFQVHLVVSRAHDRSAYAALGPYLAPGGVRAAILADRTLSETVSSTRVSTATVGPITIGGQDYLAGTFSVETYFSGADIPVIGYGVGGYGVYELQGYGG